MVVVPMATKALVLQQAAIEPHFVQLGHRERRIQIDPSGGSHRLALKLLWP
jgi:hypothetical protein